MITVIPRKITATSVNGVSVANDGSITLPVDSTPTSNSTNLVTSDGVKTGLQGLQTQITNLSDSLQHKLSTTFTTLSDLETALTNFNSTLNDGDVVSISLACGAGIEQPFSQANFGGTFYRSSSARARVLFMRSGWYNIIEGYLGSSGWVWNEGAYMTGYNFAIVANGNTHSAITSGQFVYVYNHSTLSNGLYTAQSAIAANATLSTSNLTAVSGGGLNNLRNIISNAFPTRTTAINNLTIQGIHGFVTSGGKGLHMYIPLNFSNNATGINITSLTAGLRISEGGYLGGADNFDFTSYITSSVVRVLQNLIYIIAWKEDGWGAANNTCFSGIGTITATVS